MDSSARLSKMENRDKICHRNVKSVLEPLEDDVQLPRSCTSSC
jgi:hypothetical protein